jgi:hypothetical protein
MLHIRQVLRHFDRAPLTSGLRRLADVLSVIRHVSKAQPDSWTAAINRQESSWSCAILALIWFVVYTMMYEWAART